MAQSDRTVVPDARRAEIGGERERDRGQYAVGHRPLLSATDQACSCLQLWESTGWGAGAGRDYGMCKYYRVRSC